ncbi:hypothetical protein WS94_00090 [Burkholderia territorii]|nr:hypothetical protein WS94_00090 [Burkholderia territorii]
MRPRICLTERFYGRGERRTRRILKPRADSRIPARRSHDTAPQTRGACALAHIANVRGRIGMGCQDAGPTAWIQT